MALDSVSYSIDRYPPSNRLGRGPARLLDPYHDSLTSKLTIGEMSIDITPEMDSVAETCIRLQTPCGTNDMPRFFELASPSNDEPILRLMMNKFRQEHLLPDSASFSNDPRPRRKLWVDRAFGSEPQTRTKTMYHDQPWADT